jgi:2-phospho-L-lactate transferase/gluconeogenesis factor (CofD/UPF0052 family)/glycosyltransferase involved in cell wall biosynthesis
MENKLRVAVFSGGRGTTSIGESLAKNKFIDLTLLVNAYDDGLSTGRIRAFIPGLLGPSDVRKSYSRLIVSTDHSHLALKELIEYRLPNGTTFEAGVKILRAICQEGLVISDLQIRALIDEISVKTYGMIREYCGAFLTYTEARAAETPPVRFDFGDCSIGNILLAGCFLIHDRSFNRAVSEFGELCGLPDAVMNVTDGTNLVLVALKDDGTYLKNESEIVSKQSASAILEIFLLDDYLDASEEKTLDTLSLSEKKDFLRNKSVTPVLNPEVGKLLESADMIIYGPGTQHSSLLPSYLTADLGEAIARNKDAEKVFIANIRKDNEIQSETANSLAYKLIWYLNRKDDLGLKATDLVSKFFFQTPDKREATTADYLDYFANEFQLGLDKVVGINWESGQGVHLGGMVVEELLSLLNQKASTQLEAFPYMVSIVVPCLNEAKTVRNVIHQLNLLNLQPLGLGKEVILVDGGSTDGSFEIASADPQVRSYQPTGIKGRGDALRHGISMARGNVIVFFPSDGEYDPNDIVTLVKSIISNEYKVAFGSRAIKCVDLSDRIKTIYKGDYLGYMVSKYGGMALSVLSLLLYNRFISDPLTGLKVFEARLLRSLDLRRRGVDLDTEIVAKLSRRGCFTLELPVAFKPRKKIDGKKTTIMDGLSALWALVSLRYSPRTTPPADLEKYYEKAFNSDSSVQRGEVHREAA